MESMSGRSGCRSSSSGVALFFASWIAWMILPHHKAEWKGLPNEDAVMGAMKNAGVAPGQYVFPYASCPEDMQSDAFKAKMQAGPCGNLTVWSGAVQHGQELALHRAVLHRRQLRDRLPGRAWSSRRVPNS